ncbi:Mono(2-hydroxyethyl) terephthalate hydrolase [subsurface metagenome]
MKNKYIIYIILYYLFNLSYGIQQVSGQTLDSETCAKCDALATLRIKSIDLLSSVVVPEDGDMPEYCRVLGYVLPAIHFEIRLPTKNWNGKFYMVGCGGFCGEVNSDMTGAFMSINQALKRGYAVSAMDGGHWGESGLDARWAYNNRLAEIDWAYRAVHETARVTKEVIEAFYGHKPEKSYFSGCSTGGRMAVMEAYRYPGDFDGIISGAPVIDNTGLYIHMAWVAQANIGADGNDIISSTDLKLIIEAVYEACDEIDGLKDGLIDNPPECEFDPASLLCGENESEGCLTTEQVKTLKAWYEGPKNSAGEQLYPGGLPLGSEPFWDFWITGHKQTAYDGIITMIASEFFRYVAYQEDPGESYGITDFNFDHDPQRLEFMADIINSDNPNLEEFRSRNGKMLMFHGWADADVTPLKTIKYYEAVEQNIGSREATQEFFRLFMIPGMDHCGIGVSKCPGITDDGIDPLTAIEKWVEHDEAPESLLTTKYDGDGNVLWTRPVYPYPQRVIYKGTGDVNKASSYESNKQ